MVWSSFAAGAAALAAVLAWTTVLGLRLETAEAQARAQAVLEENTRLALWRMDSLLTPLLAQENARPYFQYGAFHVAGRAYGQMLDLPEEGETVVASPVLREVSPRVLLHVQVGPDRRLSSPEVPTGTLRNLAIARGHVTAALLAARQNRLDILQQRLGAEASALVAVSLPARRPPDVAVVQNDAPAPQAEQRVKSVREFEMRKQSYQNVLPPPPRPVKMALPVSEGALTPLWIGDGLFLVRRVQVENAWYVQGCWLDWPALQTELLASVRDLLPAARLQPAPPLAPEDERRLATLPVRLLPGPVAVPPAGVSVLRLTLAGAWLCFVAAAASAAALLAGVMALSERRRVFVSAVTHELRTPLTTFRLYTDMLADGMVVGEERRREYLERLRTEAQRLGHLVENVLFYARIESGRGGVVRERLDLRAVVADNATRLGERAAAAGLTLVVAPGDGAVTVVADRPAIEQVLVNLVDNACRYAADAQPPVVTIEVAAREREAPVRVRDHGPGLSKSERKRLFQPFSKSDKEAADSAPGVGLGLALSRQLARAQGGDLTLDAAVTDGAAFVLVVPLALAQSGSAR